MSTQDFEAKIYKLIRTIARLMKYDEWPSWYKVAREQEGSDEFADYLRSFAELPEFRKYFKLHKNSVSLTEEGLKLASNLPEDQTSETQDVANAVKSYASLLQRQRVKIESIVHIGQGNKYYVHAVSVTLLEDIIPSETPVILKSTQASPYRGRIVGQESDGGILYVAFETRIFECVLPAILEIDRGFLLNQLAEQILELGEFPDLVKQIFSPEKVKAASLGEDDSVAVADELANHAIPWIQFLWGPPGAGKTYAIGRLITKLLLSDPSNKTLLVAPSNRAVDVATEQLVRQMDQDPRLKCLLQNRKVLRFGYPRKREILERPEILVPEGLDILTSKIKKIASRIAKAEREKMNEAEISVSRSELLALQEEVKSAIEEHVIQCQVVATTTTLAYLATSPVSRAKWNTVLIDEVTMVPPAMCAFLGSLPNQRLLLAGDPRQLGPVYEEPYSSNERTLAWMGKDIFVRSGISMGNGYESRIQIKDSRLVRITSQRRCTAEIWDKVKHLYPTIKNAATFKDLNLLATLPPQSGQSVVIYDTSEETEQSNRCTHNHGSWQNEFTARLCLELAHEMLANLNNSISIAVIAPYRAQIKLLKRWIREELTRDSLFESIEAGTVHQFQGSDADVVIFDLVDGPGRSNLGKLLRFDAGMRLVNVAATRARGKLVIIANKSWYRQHESFKYVNPLLWAIVDEG